MRNLPALILLAIATQRFESEMFVSRRVDSSRNVLSRRPALIDIITGHVAYHILGFEGINRT